MTQSEIKKRVESRYGVSLIGDLVRELALPLVVVERMTVAEVRAALERPMWCGTHKGHRVEGCEICRRLGK